MSSGESLISVNFARPFPVFPLHSTILMPHGTVPLRIVEPRYRQMLAHVLAEDETATGGDGGVSPGSMEFGADVEAPPPGRGARQFAMATFRGEQWMHEYHGRPAIRPVVCLGQVLQHADLEDGTSLIWLQGLCRATVVEELPPDDDVMYRRAVLRPIDVDAPDEDRLEPFRETMAEAIEHDRLGDLRGAAGLLEHFKKHEIPTSVLVEVLGNQYLADPELRYRLLASDDATERADIVQRELLNVQRLLRRARPQRLVEAPKGCNWN